MQPRQKLGAIAFLPLFWIIIMILLPFSSTLCFYPCFSKTNVQFTPTPWTASNGVKKVGIIVFLPLFQTPIVILPPLFFYFVFLPLLF